MKLCSVTRLCSKNTFQKSHQNPWVAFSCVLNPCQPILRGGTLWLRATPRDYGVSWQLIIFARFSFKIDLRTGLQGPQFLKTHLEREHFALDALGRHGKQSRAEQSSAPRQAGCVLCYQWSKVQGLQATGVSDGSASEQGSPSRLSEHNQLFTPAQLCFWKRRSWSSCISTGCG